MRKLPLSLRQNITLFLQQLDRFWQFLALLATTVVFTSFLAIITKTIIRFFDIDIPTEIYSGLVGGAVGYMIFLYMPGLDFKKPTQPFKLRQLVLPKKFYSPKMWVTETPYTAVFILLAVLLSLFLFWWWGPPWRDFGDAFFTLVILGSVYLLCVLAQGYRDFFNNQD